jgi:DNA-binding NtrC family response regulator
MGKIILVGTPEPWGNFATKTLQQAGLEVRALPQADFLDSTLARSLTRRDLLVVSPGADQLPSEELGPLLRHLGPVRILVLDGRADYSRAGDAYRGGAVGYSAIPLNREGLLELVRSCADREPPDRITIDRRFGAWRQAAV